MQKLPTGDVTCTPSIKCVPILVGCTGYNRLASMLVEMIEGEKVIIYMDFIQDVMRLVVALQGTGIEAAAFHGKSCLPLTRRLSLGNGKLLKSRSLLQPERLEWG